MKFPGITIVTICAILVAAAGTTSAATKGRILSSGKVTMYKNGKSINSFTKQGPIDDSALIACEGNCLVKMKGVSLIAEDKSRFAIKEINNSLSLFVETGKVNFAISDLSKEFSFFCPGNYYIQSEGFIVSASNSGSAKGYMQVNENGARIGMEEGTIVTRTNNGKQTIQPGQAMMLAQLPPSDGATKAVAQNDECVDDPNTPENECDDDAAAAILIPGDGGSISALGLTLVGGSVVTAGLIINDRLNRDDNRREGESGEEVLPPPPPPASPNR